MNKIRFLLSCVAMSVTSAAVAGPAFCIQGNGGCTDSAYR